ncbi:zeta toxin family protein [Pseudomonas sp. R5(2019)]|uniref:zeta toxin family protein n=1 Tax=Pseudomonas sp. R5(2019) TaxID=2697566 RepID=UPI001412D1B5|nr:zeta toxin family protein [Pseudomonas sp. R5(2019)]NBA94060.1 Zeta toxin [Pseudomonas sp. R5(2019)]
MPDTDLHPYTAQDVDAAFEQIAAGLFEGIHVEDVPKILVVAGVQGSGKSTLLENTLLPTGRYANYVRLYLPDYRTCHPDYAAMRAKGVLYAYAHSERFVKEVCGKIFNRAFTHKYNIIMECAFDSLDFAGFPQHAATSGYQFEVHLMACTKVFTHLSTINRALRSLQQGELERFVSREDIQLSVNNSLAIMRAFEAAVDSVSGSQIFLYERGLGVLKDGVLRAHSRYGSGEATQGTPYSYAAYKQVLSDSTYTAPQKHELVEAFTQTLAEAEHYRSQVPAKVFKDLRNYIIEYSRMTHDEL